MIMTANILDWLILCLWRIGGESMKKVKAFWLKNRRKVMSVICAVMVLVMSCVTAFAVDEAVSDAVTPDAAARQVFSTLSGTMNLTTILSVIGVALLAVVGLVAGWWAIRKVTRMIFSAFKKGKAAV